MAHTLDRTPLNKTAPAPPSPAAAAAEKAAQWLQQASEYEAFADTLTDHTLKIAYRDLAKDLRARADRVKTQPVRAALDIAEAARIRKAGAASTDPATRHEFNAAADAIERGETR